MRYYGLHFNSSDDVPLQVRINSETLEVWARIAPKGGEWTPWRRLDVQRNSDGSLQETIEHANHAKCADTADRLTRACTITFTGAIEGSLSLDGSKDVSVNLQTLELAGVSANVSSLMADVRDLKQRVGILEDRVLHGGQDNHG